MYLWNDENMDYDSLTMESEKASEASTKSGSLNDLLLLYEMTDFDLAGPE